MFEQPLINPSIRPSPVRLSVSLSAHPSVSMSVFFFCLIACADFLFINLYLNNYSFGHVKCTIETELVWAKGLQNTLYSVLWYTITPKLLPLYHHHFNDRNASKESSVNVKYENINLQLLCNILLQKHKWGTLLRQQGIIISFHLMIGEVLNLNTVLCSLLNHPIFTVLILYKIHFTHRSISLISKQTTHFRKLQNTNIEIIDFLFSKQTDCKFKKKKSKY